MTTHEANRETRIHVFMLLETRRSTHAAGAAGAASLLVVVLKLLLLPSILSPLRPTTADTAEDDDGEAADDLISMRIYAFLTITSMVMMTMMLKLRLITADMLMLVMV